MRSATWMTVLVGLFMFQSFWNVAAAFCVHEKQPESSQQVLHFGHHQNSLCSHQTLHHSDGAQVQEGSKHTAQDDAWGEDHQDHLPSMGHLIIQKFQSYDLRQQTQVNTGSQFEWHNHYQAPDLFLHHPPPQFSPLMVG